MTRWFVLSTLIVAGALSLAVAGQAPPAGPTPKAIAATKIEKVKDNLYIVTGSSVEDTDAFSGGNTAVFITDAGVTLVDTKLPGYGQTILDRIKTVTNKPIIRIINTHTHGDHTGGNEFFGASIESIVQENTKANMVKMDEFKGAKAKFLPTKTYKDKLTVGAGKDQIDLYYFGRGHTNGDSFVVFPALRTMHVGDFFAWKALPYVDPDNGGSVIEQPKTLAKVIGGREKRGHRHQRTYSRVDLERSQGVCRVHEGVRRVCRGRDEGRQERGPGCRRIQDRAQVQGLHRQREPAVGRGEGQHADCVRRDEEEVVQGFDRCQRGCRPGGLHYFATVNAADAITLSHMMAIPPADSDISTKLQVS